MAPPPILVLRNAARLYLDVGSHPEYASAECDDWWDLVAQDRAGDRIFADLAAQANRRLAEDGQDARIHLFKNNVDSEGNAFGSHENYLVDRRGQFTDRKSTRLNSSHVAISYAVFCLKKKKQQ